MSLNITNIYQYTVFTFTGIEGIQVIKGVQCSNDYQFTLSTAERECAEVVSRQVQ